MAALRRSNIVGAYDARIRFSELLKKVEMGEEFTITGHGRPVARLVAVKSKQTPAERRAAIARWSALSQSLSVGSLKISDLVKEGRR